MIKLYQTINFRLLLLIATAFVITAISVLYMADRELNSIIDLSQETVYSEKIDTIAALLQQENERLVRTGMVDAYQEDFQEAILKTIRKSSYQLTDRGIYPFIIDFEGRVVLHPTLVVGDTTLAKAGLAQRLLEKDSGSFNYKIYGGSNWYIYKKFSPWNWVIAYRVPLQVKYRDVRQFRYFLGGVMAATSLLFLLCLFWAVTRFTKPIVQLTNIAMAMAHGDLDRQIDVHGNDEVGMLSRSFDQMRSAISRQILELEEENVERQKAKEFLAAEKEMLAVTLRSIGDGVITTDISGRIILLNKVAERLTGWSQEEAVGRLLQEVFFIKNEQTGEICDNPVTKVINTGQIIGLANHTVLFGKDGVERSIADSGAPIFDSQSNIIGVVLVFRDVTEQIKTEKELLKVKKIESIGVLAGGIAHDFNNILAAILGNINLAVLNDKLDDRTKNLLDDAEKATLRAKDLTQQLLTFSKGGNPIKEISSLENVIRDSAGFVLHGDKVACNYTIPDELWMADIDKGQISQVIQNIVINASQAMPDGGNININAENIMVTENALPLGQKGKFVKISIQDNGAGIAPGVLEKIFDPYFSTKDAGSGLGLAITHSIIAKHNGHITVESTLGIGTKFLIYLPASQKEKPAKPIAPAMAKTSITAKVLVMDDEEILRNVTRAMLNQLGHEVDLAADGEEAVRLYKESMSHEPFDLVIMDLTIPGGMGGKDAVLEVLKLNPAAKVIVASGYSNDPVMANFRDYGFSGAIVKPFQLQSMSQVVGEVLGNATS